jgi:cytochrome c peroxidase
MSRLSACVATALLLAAARGQIFPPPPEPAGNPTTPQKALLGKALFWDEQLSTTRTMACGTCHVFARGGSDPRGAGIHPGADGLFGTPDDVRGSFGVVLQDLGARYLGSPWFGIRRQVTSRKAQSPINAAYENELFWDGRAGGTFVDPVSGQVLLASGGALETQAAAPPISEVEMSHAGHDWTHAASDLAYCTPLALATNVPAPLQAFVAGQTYAQLFAQVFGSPGVTPARILFAIAAYERTLVSDQSPYDRSLAGLHTLTLAEQQGQQVFTALCATCHVDVTVAVLARGPGVNDYRNIGVRPIAEDEGRFAVTQNPADRGRFRVPSLRNVALRAPYFHNGGMLTLDDVVDFYIRGGDFHQNQDPLILNIIGAVSPAQRTTLLAFLRTMTDPRVQNEQPPFDRPRLWSEGPNGGQRRPAAARRRRAAGVHRQPRGHGRRRALRAERARSRRVELRREPDAGRRARPQRVPRTVAGASDGRGRPHAGHRPGRRLRLARVHGAERAVAARHLAVRPVADPRPARPERARELERIRVPDLLSAPEVAPGSPSVVAGPARTHRPTPITPECRSRRAARCSRTRSSRPAGSARATSAGVAPTAT